MTREFAGFTWRKKRSGAGKNAVIAKPFRAVRKTRATSATSSAGLPALELTYCNYSSKIVSSTQQLTHTRDKRN